MHHLFNRVAGTSAGSLELQSHGLEVGTTPHLKEDVDDTRSEHACAPLLPILSLSISAQRRQKLGRILFPDGKDMPILHLLEEPGNAPADVQIRRWFKHPSVIKIIH